MGVVCMEPVRAANDYLCVIIILFRCVRNGWNTCSVLWGAPAHGGACILYTGDGQPLFCGNVDLTYVEGGNVAGHGVSLAQGHGL